MKGNKLTQTIKIIFVGLFSLMCLKSSTQNLCVYNIGKWMNILHTTNFLTFPDTNSKIITSLNEKNSAHFEVVDSIYNNGFLNVKLIVQDLKDSLVGNFNNTIGWIKYDAVAPRIHVYPSGKSVEYYDNKINKLIEYKKLNSCEYSDYNLAFLYQQRGIGKYETNDYFGAVQDLTSSINISSTYQGILRTYIYRGYAKIELQDYYGAINDIDFAINNCKPEEYNIICDICGLYVDNGSFQISGITYPEFCHEDLLVRKAICNSMLKNYQAAMTDVNSAIKLNSDYGDAYFIRGQIKDILNDKEGCCKDLSKAGELGIESAHEEIKKRCNN